MQGSVKWGSLAAAAGVALAAWGADDAACGVRADLLFLEQALIVALMVAASAHDVSTRIIPNCFAVAIVALHAFLMLVSAHYCGADLPQMLASSIIGATVIGGGMLGLTVVFERFTGSLAMGGGDLKLLFALGFAFGWQRGMILLTAACVLFSLVVLPVRVRRSGACGAYPFVPALAGATFLVSLAA